MNEQYPRRFLITSGRGKSAYALVAFDEALRDAKIADYNLVKISSILPKRCVMEMPEYLPERGSALLTAYGSISSNQKDVLIASAVAVAIPDDPNEVGVIMEFSGYCSAEFAENQVRLMAIEAMNNRQRKVKEVRSSSVESVSDGDGYSSVISAICIW